MWFRRTTLARLYEALNTMAVFDRVHDFAIHPDPADNRAYASRQTRRSEIMAEIEKLTGVRERRSDEECPAQVSLEAREGKVRNLYEVLREKECAIERVRREVEALRLVSHLLSEEGEPRSSRLASGVGALECLAEPTAIRAVGIRPIVSGNSRSA